jgi:hypothetical protein
VATRPAAGANVTAFWPSFAIAFGQDCLGVSAHISALVHAREALERAS